MTINQMKKTAAEARRFLEKVDKFLDDSGSLGRDSDRHMYGDKDLASIRRSSLDLTRSLADLRR